MQARRGGLVLAVVIAVSGCVAHDPVSESSHIGFDADQAMVFQECGLGAEAAVVDAASEPETKERQAEAIRENVPIATPAPEVEPDTDPKPEADPEPVVVEQESTAPTAPEVVAAPPGSVPVSIPPVAEAGPDQTPAPPSAPSAFFEALTEEAERLGVAISFVDVTAVGTRGQVSATSARVSGAATSSGIQISTGGADPGVHVDQGALIALGLDIVRHEAAHVHLFRHCGVAAPPVVPPGRLENVVDAFAATFFGMGRTTAGFTGDDVTVAQEIHEGRCD